MNKYEPVVASALAAIPKAIVINGSRHGVAVLMKDGTIVQGFNIESRGFDNIHGEVVAIIIALNLGYRKNDFEGMVITCEGRSVVPGCATCRQFMWEHTNPDMIIVAFDTTTANAEIYKLRDLYPLPYPSEKKPVPKPEVVAKKVDKIVKSKDVKIEDKESVKDGKKKA